jgi:hypothetical protein
MTLLVASVHPAEVVVEEMVAFERQKCPRQHTIASHDLADRDGGVVIAGAHRDATEKREPGHMDGLEGLGALAGICGEEVRVRIGQRDHPQRGLGPLPGDLGGGASPKSNWACPGG